MSRSFAAEPIAREVMPRCMPAKNHPRNAATMMAVLPAVVREEAGISVESLMKWITGQQMLTSPIQ